MNIYHVAGNGWKPGDDILSLGAQIRRGYMSWDEAAAIAAARWPEAPDYLLSSDSEQVHCHATLAEARSFAAEFGGVILAIVVDDTLSVREGAEYDHPVVETMIPARLVSQVQP